MNEVSIPVVAIIAWAAITIFSMYQRSKRREMVHRERLAMIERGLVPPPETDPAQFERVMGWQYDRHDGGIRARRAGLILIAVGIGTGLTIALAGDEIGAAIGVGCLLVLIGMALLISAGWDSRAPARHPDRTDRPNT